MEEKGEPDVEPPPLLVDLPAGCAAALQSWSRAGPHASCAGGTGLRAHHQRKSVYAPDGRYYTRSPDNTSQPIRIYTREGQVVAEAGKTGWDALLLGWAHDSSGIYFQIKISGSAAAGLVPYQPIFKLSPLTPEEALWGWVWTGLKVLGVVLALVGARWWWRRRRSHQSS